MTVKLADLEDYSTLIGRIYDASLHPDLWVGVLDQMCSAVDAKAASVHVYNPIAGKVGFFHEYGTDPVYTAMLMTTYAQMSPIGAAFLVADVDQPIGAFDFIDEQEFVESRFYKEWCAPQGYHDMLAAIIAKRSNEVGAVSATRGIERGCFGDAERRFIGLIAPHVRRSVSIGELLERHTLERETFTSLMNGLSAAVVLIDRSGRVVRMNAAADTMMSEGGVLSIRDGQIHTSDAEASKSIRDGMTGAHNAPQLLAMQGEGGANYVAALLLVEPSLGTYALIISRQGPETPAMGRALADAYGLTPREISVLMPMLQGKIIDEIADGLGIGLATAKTHLSRIFRKTDTARQADLVQKILRNLPPTNT
ncbi:MAG: helix-turn-helix transcriptional regulator [Hyphomicrobium sp.]|nr:hypothetical protein [Hyphomicrobium sp.]